MSLRCGAPTPATANRLTDCRHGVPSTVLSRNGTAVDLSEDHKPEDEPELKCALPARPRLPAGGLTGVFRSPLRQAY